MPRRTHKGGRQEPGLPLDEQLARRGMHQVRTMIDGRWAVRHVSEADALKAYRCPGCDHEIGIGVAHVVAWPADERGDPGDRRHWHTGCWRSRQRQLGPRETVGG